MPAPILRAKRKLKVKCNSRNYTSLFVCIKVLESLENFFQEVFEWGLGQRPNKNLLFYTNFLYSSYEIKKFTAERSALGVILGGKFSFFAKTSRFSAEFFAPESPSS